MKQYNPSKYFGGVSHFDEAKRRTREKAYHHMRARARELQQLVKDKHRDAKRRGDNLNMFGERRSAPGDPPAMETGGLFAAIDQELELNGNPEQRANHQTGKVTVNLTVLEHGTRTMAARPLAREALAEYKQRVRS